LRTIFVLAVFVLAVVVLVASSPASSQPTCHDNEVLQQLVTKYFGVGKYKGIVAPEMQHWLDIAKAN
jgi:hypothetical protein